MLQQFGDRLVNLVSALGTAKDKNSHSAFMVRELAQPQALAMYRSDWISRKVVDIPAFDMIREGRNWQAGAPLIEKLEAEEARLQVWPKLAKALRLARLYGGSVIIIGEKGGNPTLPLDIDRLAAGGLEYIHVASRYEITAGAINRDAASAGWGEPTSYSMTSNVRGNLTIHPSRVIPFIGADVPDLTHSQGWGDSVLQALSEAVENAGLAATSIAQLLQEAKVDVFKIPNFMANVGNEAYRKTIVDRISLANQAKSITNGLLMDAEEEYQQKQISFSQLPEVLSLYLQIAAGAADIPATRLLGQSPAGMNSTGESDLRNYYDRLGAEQEVYLRPRLEKLDEVLIRSALGSRPAEVHFVFAPLWQISQKEKSDIFKTTADAARVIAGNGGTSEPLMPIEALSDALVNRLVEDGHLPGLEAAMDEYGRLSEQEDDGEDETAAFNSKTPAEQDQALAKLDRALNPHRRLDTHDVAANLLRRARRDGIEATADAFAAEVARFGNHADGAGGLRDAAPRTLYVQRKLLNAAEFIAWAKTQGFAITTPADDLHVTVAFSRKPVDWMKAGENWNSDKNGNLTVQPGGARLVEKLGDKGAVVLLFNSSELTWRHESIRREAGASWDFPEYQPHVTITYAGGDLDLSKVEPYRGKLQFGPEIFEELDDDWSSRLTET